jgi:1,4-alpha-glucan branching enzyme
MLLSGYRLPSRYNLVIYEMHLPTFNPMSAEDIQSSDSFVAEQPFISDGKTKYRGNVATFDQAIAKLDYLQLLGVNVVELLPTAEFPGDPRGWGYNPGLPFVGM